MITLRKTFRQVYSGSKGSWFGRIQATFAQPFRYVRIAKTLTESLDRDNHMATNIYIHNGLHYEKLFQEVRHFGRVLWGLIMMYEA